MPWRSARFFQALFFSLFLLTFGDYRPVLAQVDAAAMSKAIQSIAVLTVETEGGQVSSGLAFLAGHDGRAVTAALLLKDAKKVTLRFQDGLEAVSTGIVDIDEKRGIVLIEAAAPGKSLLDLVQVRMGTGLTLNCGAVKDDAWGIVQLTVSEVHQAGSGVERYVLSGDTPTGNSGSPAIDKNGNVTGLVLETQFGRMLVPSAFISAMDFHGKVRGWNGATETRNPKGSWDPASPGPGPMDETDRTLAYFLITYSDHEAIYQLSNMRSDGHGYLQGVPQELYNYQTKMEMALRKLAAEKTEDPLRKRVINSALEAGNSRITGVNYFIQAIVAGQQSKNWGPQSQDLIKRSNAALIMAYDILSSELAALRELLERSEPFRENMPRESLYMTGIEKRPSAFRLGTYSLTADPLYLLVLYPGTFGTELGLRQGDRVISAAGTRFEPMDPWRISR